MARQLEELTLRMHCRARGLDPLGRGERRRTEIRQYAQLCRYERWTRPAGGIRAALEILIAEMWIRRRPELVRLPALTGEVKEAGA